MTLRSVYEALLIELNKAEAPNILLDDFNYFVNKSIGQYINKSYNLYDMNQQMTDNLRVLATTAMLPVTKTDIYTNNLQPGDQLEPISPNDIYGNIYEFNLPTDYLHMLNCICNFKVKNSNYCYKQDQYISFSARRQTSDNWAAIINNAYFKPSYKRPYYFIHNINTSSKVPTNPVVLNEDETIKSGTDKDESWKITSIQFGKGTKSIIDSEKEEGIRYGNIAPIRAEIRCGNNTNFELVSVYIDYIKTPQYVKLTQQQLDSIQDTSQTLEFPDYVCQEIINELVKLVLDNSSNPRLQTNLAINQTIASPVQQGQPKQ